MSRFKGLDKEELEGRTSDHLPWNPGLVEKEKRIRSTLVVMSDKMPMKMAKLALLVSQEKMLDERTNVGIGIKRVELVSVAMDNIENGRWGKKLKK